MTREAAHSTSMGNDGPTAHTARSAARWRVPVACSCEAELPPHIHDGKWVYEVRMWVDWRALEAAAQEGRNVLPDATDDQAAVIEAWALAALRGTIQ